jgi:hypothetical protein
MLLRQEARRCYRRLPVGGALAIRKAATESGGTAERPHDWNHKRATSAGLSPMLCVVVALSWAPMATVNISAFRRRSKCTMQRVRAGDSRKTATHSSHVQASTPLLRKLKCHAASRKAH